MSFRLKSRFAVGASALSAAIAFAFVACVGDDPTASSPTGNDAGGDGAVAASCKAGDNSCGTGTCVDGFCCDTACSGQCQACDVAGHEGTCTPVTGAPHHAACTGDATEIGRA